MTAEQLRKAREESANVAYLTFAKHIKSDKLGLFCFFEGKDSPYYISRVKSVFNGNYYPINCSGKSKVLKVYELIDYHREYDNYKKAFFIDKDFDFSVLNPKIYETPCYSIENLYTSSLIFSDILKSEFGLHETDEDFERCVDVYKTLQKDFHAHATLFNAWYACLVYIRNTTNQQTGVNLKDSIPKEFVSISLGGISGNYDLTAIQAQYPDALKVDNESLESKILEIGLQDKGKIFRGKFELDFMLKILNALIIDSKGTKSFISKPIKYSITNSQAISQFSQYAETPKQLIEYIEQVVK
jgi:hypothetical protein